jgi:hypothetical protein
MDNKIEVPEQLQTGVDTEKPPNKQKYSQQRWTSFIC